jgi:hypothetical protein
VLTIVERRILRGTKELRKMAYGYQGLTINFFNYTMNHLVKVVKTGRLKRLGQLFRMQKQNPYRKLALHNQRVLGE